MRSLNQAPLQASGAVALVPLDPTAACAARGRQRHARMASAQAGGPRKEHQAATVLPLPAQLAHQPCSSVCRRGRGPSERPHIRGRGGVPLRVRRGWGLEGEVACLGVMEAQGCRRQYRPTTVPAQCSPCGPHATAACMRVLSPQHSPPGSGSRPAERRWHWAAARASCSKSYHACSPLGPAVEESRGVRSAGRRQWGGGRSGGSAGGGRGRLAWLVQIQSRTIGLPGRWGKGRWM